MTALVGKDLGNAAVLEDLAVIVKVPLKPYKEEILDQGVERAALTTCKSVFRGV